MGRLKFNHTPDALQPPKSGYGFLEAVVEGVRSRVADLARILDEPHRHGGNPGYPAKGMICAYVMQLALREPYANGFLHKLDGNPRLLEICGLPCAPSEGAYSRFKKKLVEIPDFLDHMERIIADVSMECAEEIERLKEAGVVPGHKPALGTALSMDSTDILAWARPARTSRKTGEEVPSKDSDAKWGHRTAKNRRSSKTTGKGRRKNSKVRREASEQGDTEDKKTSNDELFFGYSCNVIADAHYGLPLFAKVRPANASDVTIMKEDLDRCLDLYPTLSPKYFIGDKGYDSLDNFVHVVDRVMIPILAVREPPKDKETGQRLYDGIYDVKGRPTCIGGKSMEYLGTDPEQGHLFRCPKDGCHLKGKVLFSRYCDTECYEKPEGALLRIVGIVPRCSGRWLLLYSLRTGIERYFSSAKHSRLMDKHRCFNELKVSLHVAISILSYLATALAHLKADDYSHMRHMRIRLPMTGNDRKQLEDQPRVDPGILAALVLHQLNSSRQAA